MKRSVYTGQAAVNRAVFDLLNRFEYPDIDTITPPIAPTGGEGGGEFTVSVAAADASDLSKSKADFICTGANDQITINQAIAVVQGSPWGGTIVLSEGHFICTQTTGDNAVIEIFGSTANDDGLSLVGQGCTSTIIKISGAAGNGTSAIDFFGSGDHIIRDFRLEVDATLSTNYRGIGVTSKARIVNVEGYINGNGAQHYFIDLQGDECIVEKCYVTFAGVGVFSSATVQHDITDNYFYSDIGVQGTGTGWRITNNLFGGGEWAVYNAGDSDWLISDNYMVATHGVLIEAGGDNVQVIDNRFDTGGQILFDGGSFVGCVVAGNVWDLADVAAIDGIIRFDNGAVDCQITDNVIADANGFNGIVLVSGTDCQITNNFVALADLGILVSTGTRVTVRDNKIKWPGEHGIQYDGDHGTVSDNDVFGSSQNTTNTWDNLNISGDGNLVQNNHSEPATTSPLTRYGLNIVSGNDNAVYANQLGDSSVYGTADSVDSGTNTQTSPAAGAIGGQFAY